MRPLYTRCGALDVHKKSISACVRKPAEEKGKVQIERREFGTFTSDLEELGEWLKSHQVRHLAMESTGVYWRPVWNVLEESRFRLDLTLVNPAVVKAMPGKKTDAKDAARIAELHQYGLLRGSFMPPPEIRKLRDLTRRRAHLQHDKNRVVNRISALLECANFKLGSVASNIVGVSGLRILYALTEGQHDPVHLAGLAVGSLQSKQAELIKALNGRPSVHFRNMLGDLLADFQFLTKELDGLERQIRIELTPHADVIKRLCTIPGVDEVIAWTILAEIGVDMSEFPTANHLASWAGVCPGNNESAGKRHGGRVRKGNRYLRRVLVQGAWAVSHANDCFLTSMLFRIARKHGLKRAAMAVAHRILIIAYHIIGNGENYRELGGDYHERKNPNKTMKRALATFDRLGYEVELKPKVVNDAPQPAATTTQPKRGRPLGSRDRQPRAPYGQGRSTPVPCRVCRERGIPCIHGKSDTPSRQRPRVPTLTSPLRRYAPCAPSGRSPVFTPGTKIARVRKRFPAINSTAWSIVSFRRTAVASASKFLDDRR